MAGWWRFARPFSLDHPEDKTLLAVIAIFGKAGLDETAFYQIGDTLQECWLELNQHHLRVDSLGDVTMKKVLPILLEKLDACLDKIDGVSHSNHHTNYLLTSAPHHVHVRTTVTHPPLPTIRTIHHTRLKFHHSAGDQDRETHERDEPPQVPRPPYSQHDFPSYYRPESTSPAVFSTSPRLSHDYHGFQ